MPSSVAVAICTRNRPYELGRTLSSLIRSGEAPDEVLVIDQSAAFTTAHVVQRYSRFIPALNYIRDLRVGSSAAHNLACASTTCPIIVFTDDDCQVTPGWMTAMANALHSSPRVGIAFGQVRAAEHDPARTYVVGYIPERHRRLRGRLAKLKDGGIGANMAVRVAAVFHLGGFDECLGPGAHFHACLDGDMAYRMLARGYELVHVPESVVYHHGLRETATSGPAVRRTYVGIGASYFKYIRCGEWQGLLLLGQQYGLVARTVAGNVLARRRPLGLGRLLGLTKGILTSFGRPVDRDRLRYRPESDAVIPPPHASGASRGGTLAR